MRTPTRPLDRRRFLALSAGAGLLGALGLRPSRLAAATPTRTDQYFVFAYFQGGWDVLLGLDPRDPERFTPDRVAETGIDPGYESIDGLAADDVLVPTSVPGLTFGPFIGDLADHAERIAVLRGMTMDSVAHAVARRHALTGIRPAGSSVRASSVATLLAFLLGEEQPIPNLVCGLSSFNVGHPSWAAGLTTETVEDLYQALSPGRTELVAGQRAALEEFFATQESQTDSERARALYANRLTARSLVDLDIASVFDLQSELGEMAALREAFGVDSGATGEGGPRALMAAQALVHGVSRCVSFTATPSLDSHQGADWEGDHGPRQRQGFDAVAALARHLDSVPFGTGSGTWLDHTTIVCMSEFSREPVRNSNGGRDHHLINSMLLLGGGVRGGQVIGASSDVGMLAQPVDLATGAVSSAGELITNNHIARTLLQSIGLDDDVGDFRAPPVTALLADT